VDGDAPRGRLEVVRDADALAQAAAAEFVRRALRASAERRRFTVALAGGSTPLGLYRLLARRGRLTPPGPLPWEAIHLFWGDERMVAPDHPESNYGSAFAELVAPLGLRPDNVHRIRGELATAQSAASAYEQELRFRFGLEPGELPRFDLVFLGLGADGHTASLFPGHPALAERRRLAVPVRLPAPGPDRVSLSLPVLNRAAAVVFLVSGADKREALRRLLRAGEPAASLPALAVQPAEGDLLLLADRDAAGPPESP
jgi:6-phosphogluconolactonase